MHVFKKPFYLWDFRVLLIKRFFVAFIIIILNATFNIEHNMLVRGDAMYNTIINKNKKALVASLSGNIGIDQANTMVIDFKKSISGLNTKEYILIISPENLSASILLIPILQSFIQMVAQLKFKKIYLINSDKYAAIIKQSLSNYGVADSLRYAASVGEALNER